MHGTSRRLVSTAPARGRGARPATTSIQSDPRTPSLASLAPPSLQSYAPGPELVMGLDGPAGSRSMDVDADPFQQASIIAALTEPPDDDPSDGGTAEGSTVGVLVDVPMTVRLSVNQERSRNFSRQLSMPIDCMLPLARCQKLERAKGALRRLRDSGLSAAIQDVNSFKVLDEHHTRLLRSAHTIGSYDVYEAARRMYAYVTKELDLQVTPEMFELIPTLLRAQAAGVLVVSPRWVEEGMKRETVAERHLGYLTPDNVPLFNARIPHASRLVIIPQLISVPKGAPEYNPDKDVKTWMLLCSCNQLRRAEKMSNLVCYISSAAFIADASLSTVEDTYGEILSKIVDISEHGKYRNDVDTDVYFQKIQCSAADSGQVMMGVIRCLVSCFARGESNMSANVYTECTNNVGDAARNIAETLWKMVGTTGRPAALLPVDVRDMNSDADLSQRLSPLECMVHASARPPGTLPLQSSTDDLVPVLSNNTRCAADLLKCYALDDCLNTKEWASPRQSRLYDQDFCTRANQMLLHAQQHVRGALVELYDQKIMQSCPPGGREEPEFFKVLYEKCVNALVGTNQLHLYARNPDEIYRMLGNTYTANRESVDRLFGDVLCRLLCDNRVELMQVCVRCYSSSHKRIVECSSISLARLWRAVLYARAAGWIPAHSTLAQPRVATTLPFVMRMGESCIPYCIASIVLDDAERIPDAELPDSLAASCMGIPDTCLWRHSATSLHTFDPAMTLFEMFSYAARVYYRPRRPGQHRLPSPAAVWPEGYLFPLPPSTAAPVDF